MCHYPLKNMDLGSGIRFSEIQDPEKNLFRIPDPGPGVKKALDPGSTTLLFNDTMTVYIYIAGKYRYKYLVCTR